MVTVDGALTLHGAGSVLNPGLEIRREELEPHDPHTATAQPCSQGSLDYESWCPHL